MLKYVKESLKNNRIELAWYKMHKEIAVLQFPKGVESLILRLKVRCFKRTGICIRNGQKRIDIVI